MKVIHLKDDIYQVVMPLYDRYGDWEDTEYLFQGGLADCEAYIRLKEGGYL